ncbi:methylglyoxal reductase (NADPH-dependent) gre2 [Serendipita sp. 407]|nr:methylglyoxal reductase (NADPH-dependent) gre2 [Serendipita sp. 407]
MPSLVAPSLILVTGGSGFVGSGVISSLLGRNFAVRAAIRSDEEAHYLKATFSSHVSERKLSFAYFSDIADTGAFDGAVRDVDGVVHCASPVPSTIDPEQHPDVTINTAKKGVIGILSSARQHGMNVKRIVITSSAAAVTDTKEDNYVYNEENWNMSARELVTEMGYKAPPPLRYSASKVVAEKAAWDWMKEHQPAFDLVTLLPTFVWGRSPTSCPSHYHAGSDSLLLLPISQALSGKLKDDQLLETTEMVDVLDVGEAHVQALVSPEATGQRFLLSAGWISWKEALFILHDRPVAGISVPPVKEHTATSKVTSYCSAEKGKEVLGIKYRPKADTIYETVQGAVEGGWTL